MQSATKFFMVLVFSSSLFGPLSLYGAGWGLERGRATEGDVAKLLVDQLVMKRSHTRIDESIRRQLAPQRQRQLLGKSNDDAIAPHVLLDEVYQWWLKDVMGPAEAIASNPAASCQEAQIALQSLISMYRARHFLGLEEKPEFQKLYDSCMTKTATRCREEALDECIVTGRFEQIIQTDLGLQRRDALLGMTEGTDEWMEDALKQCACYELHTVSTTKTPSVFNLETVSDTRISLKFEPGPDGTINALLERLGSKNLRDLLNGKTSGGANPFLVSVKCKLPPLDVVCSPGAEITPATARVNALDLRHREFYVDANGISKERLVGEDKFSFELGGGLFSIQIFVKDTETVIPVPVGIAAAFYIAHNKDRLGGGELALKIEGNKRGVYPVLFDFKYVGQDTVNDLFVSDSTEIELIHKPNPKPIERGPPPEPRKPIKPK